MIFLKHRTVPPTAIQRKYFCVTVQGTEWRKFYSHVVTSVKQSFISVSRHKAEGSFEVSNPPLPPDLTHSYARLCDFGGLVTQEGKTKLLACGVGVMGEGLWGVWTASVPNC